MSRVQRDSVEGRAYLDVQNLARHSGRPTAELLHLYALEGFLGRLARSNVTDQLILKGGMLLAAWDVRRPTRDVDLAGQCLAGDVDAVHDLLRRVAAIDVDDGVRFEPESSAATTIRDMDEYAGVRVTMPGRLSRAVFRFHVDVSVGDPIEPPPSLVILPRLLGGDPIRIVGYPLPMVLAEKIVTMVERAEANTRWRDYADVYLLTRDRVIDHDSLGKAIATVAGHRGTRLRPLAGLLDSLPRLAQGRWAAWRRKQLLEDIVPERFDVVLAAVAAFSDPFLSNRP